VTWQLTLTGLLIGTLVGLIGMGGGSLMTPILVIVLGFDPTVAIGTDILHGAIFKTVGGLRHRHLGTVQARLSGWMLLGSAPMSLLGVATATWLRHRYGTSVNSIEGVVLGSALLAGGLGMLLKSVLRIRRVTDEAFVLRRRDRVAALAIGLLGGYVVGLTSVGSGVFFGLTLLIVFPLRAHKVVGTDIFHAAGLLWVAGIGHLAAGNVDTHALAWLLAGSIPGVLLGAQLTLRVGEAVLQRALGVVLLVSGVKLVNPTGSDWIVAGVGLAVVVGLVGLAARRDVPSRTAPIG